MRTARAASPYMASGSSSRPRHQAREGQLHALRRVAAQDVAVERIEGEEVLIEHRVRADLREHAALRRVRIDVVEMREVRPDISGRRTRTCRAARRRRPDCARRPHPARTRRRRRRRRCQEARGAKIRSRARSRLGRLGRVPPPDRRKCRGAVFRQLRSAGRSGPSARCAACRRSIAARRSGSTAARGRAPWWRRPGRRGSWRR